MSINFDVMKNIPDEFSSTRARSAVEEAEDILETMPLTLSEQSDEMLHLINQVFFSSPNNSPRVVAFSGLEKNSMSWSVCGRAARLLSRQSSRSVCVIDGNLRSAKLSTSLSVTSPPSNDWKHAKIPDTYIPIDKNLWQAAPELLSPDGKALSPLTVLQERIGELRKLFHYVLIDTPGLNDSEDASVLTQIAGTVILVIEANVTRRRDAANASKILRSRGIHLLGTILNNQTSSIPPVLYNRLSQFI